MKKSAIYTRNGDGGTTSLIGGKRVSKNHPRVEAYGTIDELNAHLGLLLAAIAPHPQCATIEKITNNLFNIGSILACEEPTTEIPATAIATIEEQIDTISAGLPQQRGFLLPPTNEQAARANVCRTVCRRAERAVSALATEAEIHPNVSAYINRLSDYLFVLTRLFCNQTEKYWEKHWK
ncbi:MAG: cob(I)yrinic acid a,c-diamide adenosyltransferase [Bacteroidaceae bacterium]|nr:cob(I)yrinic acid a,c-diamide adenosyltransferase [Bacteroidaceae bacterium]